MLSLSRNFTRPGCKAPFCSRVSIRPLTVVEARKRSPVSEGLSTLLKDELKIEKERYRTPEAVLEGPPSGYELEDTPSSNVLLLSRSFGREEEIFVEVDLDSQDDPALQGVEDDDEDEESSLPPVQFIVNVTKGSKGLAFNCQTSGKDIGIRQVSLNDMIAADDVDEGNFVPYTGPMFEELDDTLQQAFIDYLEERGINSDFGYYLMELVHDKLEVEYMSWLTRVQGFIADE